MKLKLGKAARVLAMFKSSALVIIVACALFAFSAFAPALATGQERLKVIYSQFTMTNSATWFAREAGLFERHGLTADLIYVDSVPAAVQIIFDLAAARDPRAKTADPQGFVDMRFVRDIEQSGAIDQLYAQTK
jgi:hypothetical protein